MIIQVQRGYFVVAFFHWLHQIHSFKWRQILLDYTIQNRLRE